MFYVAGARGWIGAMVCMHLRAKGIEFVESSVRADNLTTIQAEIDGLARKPTNVFCLIGRTSGTFDGEEINTIDYLEKPGKLAENLRDNLFAPLSLALFCQSRGIHMTYLGTGCIFEYDSARPMECADGAFGSATGFSESDVPNFFGSSYSTVKGYTDRLMHQMEDTVLNLRIRMPIVGEPHKRNFITKIAGYPKICSLPNSMTVLDDLVPVAVQLALDRKKGTFNLTNPGVISHNEILGLYRVIVDPAKVWENIDVAEQNSMLASRRSNNFLETAKLESAFPGKIPHIRNSIANILISYRTSMDNARDNALDNALDKSLMSTPIRISIPDVDHDADPICGITGCIAPSCNRPSPSPSPSPKMSITIPDLEPDLEQDLDNANDNTNTNTDPICGITGCTAPSCDRLLQ